MHPGQSLLIPELLSDEISLKAAVIAVIHLAPALNFVWQHCASCVVCWTVVASFASKVTQEVDLIV